MLVKQKERMFFAVISIIALLLMVISVGYEIGTIDSPKGGFFPFLISAIIFILSLYLFISTISTTKGNPQSGFFLNGLKRLVPFISVTIIYALFLEQLGFLLSTFIFMVFLLKIMGQPGWRFAVLFSLISVIFCWLCFQKWLGVPLPTGIISF